MAQLNAEVYGQVQGVSYRAYAVDEARRLGLTGWVRNQADGTVQTTAVGPANAASAIFGLAAAWLTCGAGHSSNVYD